MLKLARQSGETIIEVLLALSILGLVLGVSYASASRSIRSSQNAQERTVASQHAQSLLEMIKAYVTLDYPVVHTAFFPGSSQDICLSTDIDEYSAVRNDPEKDLVPVKAPGDPVCSVGELYQTKINIRPIAGAPMPTYEYTAQVDWDSLVSGDPNQVLMRYRWVRITP